MHAIGTAGCDRVARPASARSSRGRRLAEPRRETRRGIAARSAAVRLRGSRSARRSARSEGGARSVPRERSVLRRAVAKRSFAEPPESAARRRQEEPPDEQSTASIQRTLPQGNHHVEAEHEGMVGEETTSIRAAQRCWAVTWTELPATCGHTSVRGLLRRSCGSGGWRLGVETPRATRPSRDVARSWSSDTSRPSFRLWPEPSRHTR